MIKVSIIQKTIIGFMSIILLIIYIYRYFSLSVEHSHIHIVCTTSMITDAVRVIGGSHVKVIGLMGPGIDPHTYHARESDVHKLATADIIFYHGLHLEGKLATLLERIKRYMYTQAVTDVLDQKDLLSTGFQDIYDPHVWHDVQLWMQIVQGICNELCNYDSVHANEYMHNTAEYLSELQKLDHDIRTMVTRIPENQRILITAHDAFHYFARAYGFTVIGLQGISTDAQISMRDVQCLAQYIVDHKVHALFVESSISHRNLYAVKEAVHARGWQVMIGDELYSDALGNYDSQEGTYRGMMRHNIQAIFRGLTGDDYEINVY